ncbi:hypothetical protein K2173_008345 [Erythroxylum novogranatense]|uniref:Pectin acetylesterase n=1 Tax=Erythroxylum novogranatense TaxID=1862640 RepID=A0AAV8TIU5_9ROSI|nr:hypothetical protein K2173_008345 [Erythroxylum novogranatense]
MVVVVLLHLSACSFVSTTATATAYVKDEGRLRSLASMEECRAAPAPPPSPPPPPFVFDPSLFLMVPLTLINGARSQGAVCLDGSLPGYHLHRGSGAGRHSWIIQFEGGSWCNSTDDCMQRKSTRLGSSNFMEKELPFIGMLSNKSEENPDFFNWNRVKLRYCDGASFSGEGQNKTAKLYYRGQRIWKAAIQTLMAKGMRHAKQVILSGCSSGAVASVIHCDGFRNLLPASTKVRCVTDAGMFLDAIDLKGKHHLREMLGAVVNLQGVEKNLPSHCTHRMDPTLCFFPQNLINGVKTPLFVVNAAYDSWQLQFSVISPSADPYGVWNRCKQNRTFCSSCQIQFLQDLRNQMLEAVRVFSTSKQNGLFINSCFVHCQLERQDAYPMSLAESVGDWYFDRREVKAIDCAYPCDKTCHDVSYVFSRSLRALMLLMNLVYMLDMLLSCFI